MSPLLTGHRLGGRYLIGRRIGTGGFGSVYEGVQEDLRRRVAIKVLRVELARKPVAVERFRREAMTAAGLGHPHIVQVTDFKAATAEEPPFLVMELLAGRSLHRLVEETWPIKMTAERLARIGVQLLSALDAAHAAGIVHRDIKPDNVFLCDTSVGADLLKVLDFGIAKLVDDKLVDVDEAGSGDPEPLTTDGAVLGTPAYMASEQARGLEVDGRADVYGAGGCLFFAATGRHPVLLQRPRDFVAIAGSKVPALASLRPDLDPALSAIVDRALMNERAERFASAAQMHDALLLWLSGGATRPSTPGADLTSPARQTITSASHRNESPRAETKEDSPPPPSPPTTLAARQVPSPAPRMSVVATSTLTSPGIREARSPARSRVWLASGMAAAIVAVAIGARLSRDETTHARLAGAGGRLAPSATAGDLTPGAAAVPGSFAEAASALPSLPTVSSALPSPTASPPAPSIERATPSPKPFFGPYEEHRLASALTLAADPAARDCSARAGPRTQTFVVRFARKDGTVSQIASTGNEPPSAAQACIEEKLRQVRVVRWDGEPREGVTAITITLRDVAGVVKAFD